jgi:uncharacterized membrane protein
MRDALGRAQRENTMNPAPNPYQAPTADFDVPTGNFGELSIGRCVSESFEATKRYFPLWLWVGLVGGVLSFLSAITFIGYFVLVPVFAFGMTKFLLNMIDGRAEFGDLFAGFSNYGSVLGRTLMVTLCFIALVLVGDSLAIIGQVTKSPALQAVGGLVNLVFSVVVVVRFYFAMFFVVDRDMGGIEAMSASWNATRGKNLTLLGLGLVGGLIAIAGLLALVVGFIFTLMMAYVCYASAYRQVAGPRP